MVTADVIAEGHSREVGDVMAEVDNVIAERLIAS